MAGSINATRQNSNMRFNLAANFCIRNTHIAIATLQSALTLRVVATGAFA
jgi:hypothetical protein